MKKQEKTTAESGLILIYMGILSAMATIVIGLLEIYELNQYVLSVVIIMTVVNALIGYFVATKKRRK